MTQASYYHSYVLALAGLLAIALKNTLTFADASVNNWHDL